MATLVGASQIQLRSLEVGFAPLPEGVVPIKPDPLPEIALGGGAEHFGTIVIGPGTGGGVVAGVLARRPEHELRAKMAAGVRLRFDQYPLDIQGRVAGFAKSVTGGVSVKQALTAGGILDVRRSLFSFGLPSGNP